MNPYQFFLKHAGQSYNPATETQMQGRIRNARHLAEVERKARDGGFFYIWSIDPDCLSSDWIDDNEDGGRNNDPWQTWQCAMYNSDRRIVNSLHGIDFGRDGSPHGDTYKRVVEAELALDGLTNEPQGELRGQS
jgi:hypothetical protein